MSVRAGYKPTEIGELPEEWEIVSVGEIASDVRNGFASGKRDENGIAQVRMNNITKDGKLVLDNYLKVPIPERSDGYMLQPEDLLFNNTNSFQLLGKSAIFEGAPFPCTFSNHFTRIRVDRNKVLPQWVHNHLLAQFNRGYFRTIAMRFVGQSSVRTQDLLSLRIPLPPIEEQTKISNIISTADNAIQKTNEIVAKTQRLKKGLMQKLLTKGMGHTKSKQTELGELPEDWKVSTIGEECDVGTGGTPSRLVPGYFDGKIPWV